MNRTDKIAAAERMAQALQAVPHVFLADYQGLTVNQATELRRRVRRAGGTYEVVKNRLAKRAAAGTAAEKLADHLRGPRAMVIHRTDPVALAKVLVDFAKDNPQLQVVAAVVDSRDVVDSAGVKALALLPGLNELRAQLLSLVQTPASMLVRLLATPGSQIARAVDMRREKLEGSGDSQGAS